MLKPYPRKSLTVNERIANYRISRGRRIFDNILGILANSWRCFRAPFLLSPVKVQKIAMAVLTLHKWLNSDRFSRNVYCPPGLTDNENPVTGEITQGSWRDDSPLESLVSLQTSLKHNYNRGAQEMGQEFTTVVQCWRRCAVAKENVWTLVALSSFYKYRYNRN